MTRDYDVAVPKARQYCVWPIGVPPVPTQYWTADSWVRWEDKFRPANYTGGRYDTTAWETYAARVARGVRDDLRAWAAGCIERVYGREAADAWVAENIRLTESQIASEEIGGPVENSCS